MDSPVQDVIIGNIPGPLGAEVSCNHDDNTESFSELEPVNGEMTMICDKSNSVTGDHRDQINTPEEQNINSDDQLIDHSDTQEQCAAVQTRAMVARKSFWCLSGLGSLLNCLLHESIFIIHIRHVCILNY